MGQRWISMCSREIFTLRQVSTAKIRVAAATATLAAALMRVGSWGSG
jgi:hypothetical protein